MNKLIFYIPLYSLLLGASLSVALLFKPFQFVDVDHSYIRCLNDGKQYELGPNFIFALDEAGLDSFNDTKARKLCEHRIIMDYIDSYPAPAKINYNFEPAIVQNSSWLNVIFVFFLVFSSGTVIIENLGKFLKIGLSSFGKHLLTVLLDLIS